MIDKKFKTDAWASYFAQAVSVCSGFLFMAVVTRYGSIAIFGALMALTALSNMLANLLTFRTNEAVVAFYKQGETIGDLTRSKFALVAGMTLDLLVGTGLFLAVFSLAGTIADRLLKDVNAVGEVRLYAFYLFIFFIRGSAVGYLQARENFKLVSYLSMGEYLSKALLAVGMILCFDHMSLRLVVLAVLIPACLFSLVFFILAITGLVARFSTVPLSLDKGRFGEFARFSGSTFLSSSLKAGNQNIDTIVVGFLTDTHTVGLYGLFRQFLSPLAFLSNPFASLTYPKFVQAVAQRRYADIGWSITTINHKLRVLFAAAILLMIVILIIYSEWVGLYMGWGNWSVFFIMTITAITIQKLWWARPFSSAVDPNISLKANALALIFVSGTVYPATLWFGLVGTAGVMLVNALMQMRYWGYKLNSITTNKPVSERAK